MHNQNSCEESNIDYNCQSDEATYKGLYKIISKFVHIHLEINNLIQKFVFLEDILSYLTLKILK